MVPLILAITLVLFAFAHGMYRTYRGVLSVCDVAVWFTCAFFGLGYVVSDMYATDSLPRTMQSMATSGFIAVILYVVGLLVGSAIVVRRRGPGGVAIKGTLSTVVESIGSRGITVVFVGFLFIIILRFGLAIAFGIVIAGDEGTKSFDGLAPWYITAVVFSWSPFLMTAAQFWAAYNLIKGKGLARIFSCIILIMLILAAFSTGRREILATLFTVVLVYAIYYRPSIKAAVWAALILVFAVFVLMPFFYKLRTARNRFDSYDPLTRTVLAAQYVISGQGDEVLDASYRNNMSFRALFVLWPGRLMEGQDMHESMNGDVMKLTFIASLPRAWFPWKALYDWPETAVTQHYSFPAEDYAESWAGYGVADFGMTGAFVYGVILSMSLAGLEKLALWFSTRSRRAGSWTLAVVYIVAVQVEAVPVQFMSDFRNLVLLLIPVLIVMPFVTRRKIAATPETPREQLPDNTGVFGMPA